MQRLSATVAPARLRAQTDPDPGGWRDPYSGFMLGSAFGGAYLSPDLALTLSHVYCAVDTISADFGTATCQTFEDLGNEGRQRVLYSAPGIGVLARKIRWQPNAWQTAKAFWSTLAWQYLLRPAAYAELLYRPGVDGFVEQLVPRNPDRVREAHLPSGKVQFQLRETNGQTRIVTQDEMFVVRNTSMDGLLALGRLDYGRKALSSALTLQAFSSEYFEHGTAAALLAIYKGNDMEPEDEAKLHASLTRFTGGPKNAGGIMLVPEDIDVKPLGVSPHDAELLGLKNLSGRDVARLFKMPPSWLGIENAASYGSQIQDAQNYKNRCQLPIAVEFEQAIQRDLILAQDRFFVKFNMDYLTRGNLLERMQAYEIGIRSRVLRPSEARVREDMSPDRDLDRLSEGDFRPGTSGGTGGKPEQGKPQDSSQSARAHLKGMLALHDTALRCLRRERHQTEALAKKFASDVPGWQAGLRDFYAEHAGFVAQAMRLDMETSRAFCAQHGSQLEQTGIGLFDDHFVREEAEELCALALSDERAAA